MFALEIDFHDGVSTTEMILVRRPHAIVGNSDFAHVVVEGSSGNLCELRISRGLGREFRCQPLKKPGDSQPRASFVPGVYSGEAELDLGGVTARIMSLDIDLQLRPEEDLGCGGVRVLRSAFTERTPAFPAVMVLGKSQLFMSFPAGESLLVGRSRNCGLRLDAADVSSEHARIGLEGDGFWIEDLGSTNGTYVGSEKVRGRRAVPAGEPILVGSEILIAGVRSAEDVSRLTTRSESRDRKVEEEGYPRVMASSEFIQPAELVLSREGKFTIGRDPASDIWIPAGHISRIHAELRLNESGAVEITDLSSNGIYVHGDRLPRRTAVPLPSELSVIDLRRGIRLGVCFSREDEVTFSKVATRRERPGETVTELNTVVEEATRPIDRSTLQDTLETGAEVIREAVEVSESSAPAEATDDTPAAERVSERRDRRKATLINGKMPTVSAREIADGLLEAEEEEEEDLGIVVPPTEEPQRRRFGLIAWLAVGALLAGVLISAVFLTQTPPGEPTVEENVFTD